MDTILLTPAALVDLLSQVDELKDYDIGVTESPNGDLQLQIGETTYSLNTQSAVEVVVDEDVAEEVADINEEAYEELGDEVDMETVESGILKEIAKTLLVGGLVRLTGKLMK